MRGIDGMRDHTACSESKKETKSQVEKFRNMNLPKILPKMVETLVLVEYSCFNFLNRQKVFLQIIVVYCPAEL